jgi:Na+-transporting NADH:ubiquinone oxidoreductase subunit NqrC
VCGLAADMKCRILTVWTLLEEVLRLSQEQQQWLDSQEQILKDMDSRRGQMSQDEIQDLISRVEVRIYNLLTLSERLFFIWFKSRPHSL